MNGLRRFGVGLLATLLTGLLYLMAGTHVGNSTIRSRDAVKSWFAQSNFYGQAVDVALEKAATSTGPNKLDIPVNDPGIQAIAKEAFNAPFLQQTVEQALDASYGWLDGSKPNLDVKVDLSEPKNKLAEGLAGFVTNRVSSLPVCPVGTDFSNFDGYNATCRPSAISAQQAGELAKQNFLNMDFLKDPVISSANIKTVDKEGSGTINAQEKLEGVKTAYQQTGSAPVVLAVLSLLAAAGIVFLSADKLKGVRRVGIVLLTSGLLLLLTYVGIGAAMDAVSSRYGQDNVSTPKLAKMGTDLVGVVANDIKNALFPYVLWFILLGSAAIITSIVLKKRTEPHEKKPEHTEAEKLEAPKPEKDDVPGEKTVDTPEKTKKS